MNNDIEREKNEMERVLDSIARSDAITGEWDFAWLIWQAARAQQAGSGEAVARVVHNTETGEVVAIGPGMVDLPGGTKLYTHPSASVPFSVSEIESLVSILHRVGDKAHMIGGKNAGYLIDRLADFLSAAPQPAGEGWSCPIASPPEMGVPVIGWNPDWIDPDFNPKGLRECFRFGDGTEWHSGYWRDEQDCYTTGEGAPTRWTPLPKPPEGE